MNHFILHSHILDLAQAIGYVGIVVGGIGCLLRSPRRQR